MGNQWLIAANIADKNGLDAAQPVSGPSVYSSISQSNKACCTQQHLVEEGASYQPVAWMKCNGIREQITSNPGFRKLHPGTVRRPVLVLWFHCAAWERFVGPAKTLHQFDQGRNLGPCLGCVPSLEGTNNRFSLLKWKRSKRPSVTPGG
jgi:hypothetical protein